MCVCACACVSSLSRPRFPLHTLIVGLEGLDKGMAAVITSLRLLASGTGATPACIRLHTNIRPLVLIGLDFSIGSVQRDGNVFLLLRPQQLLGDYFTH